MSNLGPPWDATFLKCCKETLPTTRSSTETSSTTSTTTDSITVSSTTTQETTTETEDENMEDIFASSETEENNLDSIPLPDTSSSTETHPDVNDTKNLLKPPPLPSLPGQFLK